LSCFVDDKAIDFKRKPPAQIVQLKSVELGSWLENKKKLEHNIAYLIYCAGIDVDSLTIRDIWPRVIAAFDNVFYLDLIKPIGRIGSELAIAVHEIRQFGHASLDGSMGHSSQKYDAARVVIKAMLDVQ
jgi:hypothetical protein